MIFRRNNMLGKKGLIKFLCALMIGFLLICFAKIYQIQYQSIWAESKLKPMWNYDIVRFSEGMWLSPTFLGRDDKIKLYFALGSAKEYKGNEKHYTLKLNENSLIYQRNLIGPCISLMDSRSDIDHVSIVWEYEKNTIYVGTGNGDDEKATRYFLDEKNAWVLYDLFMKYDCIGHGGAM